MTGPGSGPPPGGPPYPGYGYGYPQAPPPTNTMAVLGLVFAFVAWPAGIVLSAIGLSQTSRRREGGRGLAVAGLTVSLVLGAVTVLLVGLLLVGATSAVRAPVVAADPSAATSGTSSAPGRLPGTVSCTYLPDTSGNPTLVDVGSPPDPAATPATGTTTLRMRTNQGDLTLTLNRSKAPCAAASFGYLASKKFFDGSPCHRLVDQPSFGVLQCGDPSGTGQGGPAYTYGTEVTPDTTYPRGTIAMANTGQPNSTGSQFFLCFADTDLSPDYTVVGTVDAAGLAVLDKVAAAGEDGSLDPSPGGGKPNLPVTITTMTQ